MIVPILFAALLLFSSSCSVVKDYPAGKPFVYTHNIELQGKFTTEERKQIVSQLNDQLHDSILARRVEKLIGWEKGPRIFYDVLQNPPVYDSLNADKSVQYMQALLHSLGYYRDSITYRADVDTVQSQYRTTVNFNVVPGTLFRVDSIAYTFRNDTIMAVTQPTRDTLQQVVDNARGAALIKEGDAFAKPQIAAERDRLTDVFRNNGYLRFSSDELIAVWDTVGLALLRPTLDPLEQLEQLEALRQRRENPTATLELRLRANPDTSHLVRYRVGNVTLYPDLSPDTALYTPVTIKQGDHTIITYRNLFRPRVVTENLYLNRGDLYSQRNYLKTLNRYNSIGAWRLVTIDQIPRGNTDTVDFVVKLTPARKYLSEINLEGSQNWGSTLTAGNLIGINYRLQNRNFARGANQSNTSLRYGVEIATNDTVSRFIRTHQLSFGQTITFPRMLPRISIPDAWKENLRTTFTFNANWINRIQFVEVYSLNTSWGYEFNWKNKLLAVRIPNIELAVLQRKQELEKLIDSNGSYRYIFNDGLVSSNIVSFTLTGSKKNVTNYGRFNWENSGWLLGLAPSDRIHDQLYRFIKLDADLRKTLALTPRTSLALRLFAGAGHSVPFALAKEADPKDSSKYFLPFFKAYFAGGANSMRAWQLRKLGPGSSKVPTTARAAPERFGDMQLEFNTEYRFFITDIRGVLINSALFVDMGNIWYLRRNESFPNGEFQFNRLLKDLAVGVGTGLRIDFGLFLIRLDYAHKARNPNIIENRWFPEWTNDPDKSGFRNLRTNLGRGQFQLGVTYPF
ncbi:MAG TPA: BamA/TamA family outer membrane protein [Chitinophagaceae bacterium]